MQTNKSWISQGRESNADSATSISTTDSIETRGFLSAEIAEYRKETRDKHARLFAICEEKSDYAIKRLFEVHLTDLQGRMEVYKVVALGAWMRCVRACQAALILLEHGLVPEAQAQIRVALEFLFFAVASLKDEDVANKIHSADIYERKRQARAIFDEKNIVLTEEQAVKLKAFIADPVHAQQGIPVIRAAEIAGMTELYATAYRTFSRTGTHATLASIDTMFAPTGDQPSAIFGPTDRELSFTIGIIDTCLAAGSKHFDAVLT